MLTLRDHAIEDYATVRDMDTCGVGAIGMEFADSADLGPTAAVNPDYGNHYNSGHTTMPDS